MSSHLVSLSHFLTLFLLASQPAIADCQRFGDLKVRKALNGSKDEQKPAVVSFENPDGVDDYFNVDLAIAFGSIECGSTTQNFMVSPKIEYHRSTAAEEIDNSTLGINAEYFFRSPRPRDQQRGPIAVPFFLAEAAVTRDSANDATTRKFALFASAKSFVPGWPGAAITFPAEPGGIRRPIRLRYYPYIGIENYENLAIKKDDALIAPAIDESFVTIRAMIEYYPFRRESKQGLQITAEWAYRNLIGSSEFVNDSTQIYDLGINYYFDQEGHVGIGFNYQRGDMPSRNFLEEERSSIALAIKW